MTSLSAKKIIKLFSLRSADIHLEVNRNQNTKLNEEKDEPILVVIEIIAII